MKSEVNCDRNESKLQYWRDKKLLAVVRNVTHHVTTLSNILRFFLFLDFFFSFWKFI